MPKGHAGSSTYRKATCRCCGASWAVLAQKRADPAYCGKRCYREALRVRMRAVYEGNQQMFETTKEKV